MLRRLHPVKPMRRRDAARGDAPSGGRRGGVVEGGEQVAEMTLDARLGLRRDGRGETRGAGAPCGVTGGKGLGKEGVWA